jgi:hypothetical protein
VSGRPPAQSSCDPEQLGGVAAEDADSLLIAQRMCCEDRVNRVQFPNVGIVAAEHDLTGADLCDKVPHGFGRED